ncbi:MAG: hypothetical protein IKG21_12855 [Atopobiaceae bacterium]|nr:hypothetical protein [Atopobiaceae bacterium]
MKFEDMTEMQRVAAMQAVYNELGKLVSKKGDTLRSQVDEQVMGFYEATGAKSYDVNIDGQKVGTYSVTVSKASERTVLDLEDSDALDAWLATDAGLDAANDWLMGHIEQFVSDHFKSTGELPDGVVARTVTEPERVKGTVLRVDARKVARAMRGELPTAVAGLLEGGA